MRRTPLFVLLSVTLMFTPAAAQEIGLPKNIADSAGGGLPYPEGQFLGGRSHVRQYMRFDSHFGKVKGGVHSVRWVKHVARANATFLNEIVATAFKVPITVMLDCHTTTF